VLWFADHPFVALGLLYGLLVYLGFAVLIGVPGRAIMALMIVGPAAWWCFCRYTALTDAQASKLSFFTWDNRPLRLSEDILSSKVVYCIGLRNEGAKAVGNVRVNIDLVEGHPRPTFAASLPIFRTPADNADLQPGESEYFCVMRTMDGPKEDDGTVVICCHSDLITPSFSLWEMVEGRAMTLSAYSDGAPQITKRIQISSKREAGATWSLHLKLLPDADKAPMPVVEQSPVARPPLEEAPAHSERVRRLLARQAQA
jgi:hypothetical protein